MLKSDRPYPEGIAWDEAWRQRKLANTFNDQIVQIRCLILTCERRIDHLALDHLIDTARKTALINENRRFIMQLQQALEIFPEGDTDE